jgi:hypothetical protein
VCVHCPPPDPWGLLRVAAVLPVYAGEGEGKGEGSSSCWSLGPDGSPQAGTPCWSTLAWVCAIAPPGHPEGWLPGVRYDLSYGNGAHQDGDGSGLPANNKADGP